MDIAPDFAVDNGYERMDIAPDYNTVPTKSGYPPIVLKTNIFLNWPGSCPGVSGGSIAAF